MVVARMPTSAPIGGYVCASTMDCSHGNVIALSAMGQLGIAAPGQIQLALGRCIRVSARQRP